MLGDKIDSIGKDESDAVGEIVNIIYGQAKIDLNRHGFALDRAFPTVFFGDKISECQFAIGKAVVLAFATPAGIFEVDIEFSKVG
jgi:CheY-specific phosphatase CheX